MKLRNKKTGEIVELTRNKIFNYDIHLSKFNSLAELNENWEDYEEPEGWWFIDGDRAYEAHCTNSTLRNMTADQEVGNYFHYKEEAEKAVEKLKAWKRLKDNGFRFHEWYKPDGCEPFIVIETNIDDNEVDNMELQKDLDLLFGGNNA